MENNIVAWITGIIAAINAGIIAYAAYRKLKPEVKRMETDVEKTDAEIDTQYLENARISGQMLLDRINELKGEIKAERDNRIESEKSHERDIEALKKSHENAIIQLERLRREDKEYFRRRIKDLEAESRDYRQWAAKLVKQVVEAGKVPAPFIPTVGESETGITAIRTDLEGTTDEKKAARK